MNTDIVYRWRDAINDPPKNDRPVPYRNQWTSGFVLLAAWFRSDGAWIDGAEDCRIEVHEGDQWLEVTEKPAIPLGYVQAVVDLAELSAETWDTGNAIRHEYARGIRKVIGMIKEYTGVTPTGGE